MPITQQQQLNNGCLLILWEITEEVEELLRQIKLTETEHQTLDSYGSISRKKEFLISRIIVQKILGADVKILHNNEGKPHLQNSYYNISISHTKGILGIILGKNCDVALDIEYKSERVKRVISRFLSEKEQQHISSEQQIKHLYQHWCAKECIVKLVGKKNIHMALKMLIQPFDPDDKSFIGIVQDEDKEKKFTFYHSEVGNHLLVWCCQSNK